MQELTRRCSRVYPEGAVDEEERGPYCVRWVRRFLARQASDESLGLSTTQ